MRKILALTTTIMLFHSTIAAAQSVAYGQQQYQPQQLSENNVRPPAINFTQNRNYPPVYYGAEAAPVQEALHSQQPQNGDYGQSFISDLRQLNF